MSSMFRTLSKVLKISALALLFASLISPLAHSQSATTGAIGGTVTDGAGALLPNAQITVVSADSQAVRKAKSNSSGEFKVTDLAPGTYTTTVVVDGFETSVTNNVVVAVGSTATITGLSDQFFDFGVPFFYGRTVFTGIEGTTAGSAAGPYYAY